METFQIILMLVAGAFFGVSNIYSAARVHRIFIFGALGTAVWLYMIADFGTHSTLFQSNVYYAILTSVFAILSFIGAAFAIYTPARIARRRQERMDVFNTPRQNIQNPPQAPMRPPPQQDPDEQVYNELRRAQRPSSQESGKRDNGQGRDWDDLR